MKFLGRCRNCFRRGAPAAKRIDRNAPIPARTLRKYPFLQERIDNWVIEKRFCEDIRSNAELARSIGIEPNELTLFFRDVIREDPRTWRTRLRVEEARALLLSRSDLLIAEVAEAVGFSDSSNFARQFRRYTGFSPGAWREMHDAAPDAKRPIPGPAR